MLPSKGTDVLQSTRHTKTKTLSPYTCTAHFTKTHANIKLEQSPFQDLARALHKPVSLIVTDTARNPGEKCQKKKRGAA